ncbi:MAG: hypothetical protein J6K01_06685 [Paludibacteraceae bacterium]|nr:hypothetical protein [Paludibacteraceae bacterium]
MNYEVSFFGVTTGNEVYSPQAVDREYYRFFYSERVPSENGMWVEARESEGVPYMYYTYVIRENVSGIDARSGSNFGLSLRLSEYCRDVFSVYEILDATFNKFFRNVVLLVSEGGICSFLKSIRDFGENKHKEIEQFVGIQLQNLLYEGDFAHINFSGKEYFTSMNLLDAKYYKAEIEAALVNGPVFLSEKEPTISIKQEFQQKELEVSKLHNQIKEKEDVMAKNKRRYENQISDKDKELEQIKKEKDDSKDKLKQIKKIVEGIPLENTVAVPGETPTEPDLFRDKKDIVLAVVLTFLCCLLIYVLFLRSGKPEPNGEPTVVENSYGVDSVNQDSSVVQIDSTKK